MIADSKHHYTYRITNILESKHYYGVRSSVVHPKEDLGIKYLSSSSDKDFVKDQKENPQNYKYKIVRISETRKQAVQLEVDLHNKFDVGINESFYNRGKQKSAYFGNTGKFTESIKNKALKKFKETHKIKVDNVNQSLSEISVSTRRVKHSIKLVNSGENSYSDEDKIDVIYETVISNVWETRHLNRYNDNIDIIKSSIVELIALDLELKEFKAKQKSAYFYSTKRNDNLIKSKALKKIKETHKIKVDNVYANLSGIGVCTRRIKHSIRLINSDENSYSVEDKIDAMYEAVISNVWETRHLNKYNDNIDIIKLLIGEICVLNLELSEYKLNQSVLLSNIHDEIRKERESSKG